MTLDVDNAASGPEQHAGRRDDSSARRGPFKRALGWLFASATRALFATFRALGPERSIRLGSWLGRRIGPLTPEHRVARRNLEATFPEMSKAERDRILTAMWDNLGRLLPETVHLDWILNLDPATGLNRVTDSGLDYSTRLAANKESGIFFSAHLANWELTATAAAAIGQRTSVLYRAPTNEKVAASIVPLRGEELRTYVDAAKRGALWGLASAFERGELIGMMMDQRDKFGIEVPFFGRPALSNPIAARLARTFEVPVHGVRVIRKPDSRFHVEITPPIELPRDRRGKVDVFAATARINEIIEGWVREHPEQWLWIHDRWRIPPPQPESVATPRAARAAARRSENGSARA
ncbi:MAG: lipid A biosynthesis lauroyl acyltransferase [Bauldia sp.]|nr:lipid A biosynthesis lauroyl acyltransferase [Bauldia sp.]